MKGQNQTFEHPTEANDPFGMAKFSPRRNTVKIVVCLVLITMLLASNTATGAASGSPAGTIIPATALAIAIAMIWILVKVSIRTVEGEIWIRRLGMGDLEFRVEPTGNDEIAKALHALEAVRQTCIRVSQMDRVQQLSDQLQAKNAELETTLSELRKTQDQIVTQKKLAELGQLAAGVAHEIRNPLQFITNFAQASEDMISELEEITKDAKTPGNTEAAEITAGLSQTMQRIIHHSDRANKIISDMMAIGRQGSGEFRETHINPLLITQTNLAHQAVRAQDPELAVDIKLDLDEDLEPVNAVPEDLARVFTHLVTNACQAMSEKLRDNPEGYLPKLTLETRKTTDGAAITVRDNGAGISPSTMEHIFNPFFTTKTSQSNTGLGLSLSYDIVREHGGTITPESRHGEYTRMTVLIPYTKGEDAPGQTAEQGTIPATPVAGAEPSL